jgi:hypothetical protein
MLAFLRFNILHEIITRNIIPILRIFAIFYNASVTQNYTGPFITFSVITNIYNKKTKEPTLMALFTATGKFKRFFYN